MDVSQTEGEIAQLGVVVRSDGVDTVTRELQQMADVGEESAERTGRAGTKGAAVFSQAFTDQIPKAREAAQQFATAFEREFAADMARVREGAARGFLTPEQARAAGREAAQEYNRSLLSGLDALGRQGLNAGNSKLYAELAGSLKPVADAAERGTLHVGRLGQELASAARQAVGASPIFGQLGYAIGSFTAGSALTLGVLGGIALIGLAYDKLTESSKKAREENDRLLKSLHDVAQQQRETEKTRLEQFIASGKADVDRLQRELASAREQAQATATAAAIGGESYALPSALGGPDADDAKKKLAKAEADVRDAEAALTALVKKGAEDRDKIISSDLANIVRSGQATAAQRSSAESLLRGYQSTLSELQRSGSSDTATITSLIGRVQELDTALHGSGSSLSAQERALFDAAEAARKASDEYAKHAIAAAKLALETQQSISVIQEHISLLKSEGLEHDRIAKSLEYRHEREKLVLEIIAASAGEEAHALTVRLLNLDVQEKLSDKLLVLANNTKVAKQAQEEFNNAVKNLKPAPLPPDPQAAAIKKASDDATRARETLRQEFARGIEHDLASAISGGFSEGFKSAERFADNVVGLFRGLAGRFAALKLSELFTGSGVDESNPEEAAAQHIKAPGATFTPFDQKQLGTFALAAGAVVTVADAMNVLTGASRHSAAALQELGEKIASYATGTRPQIEALRTQIEGSPVQNQQLQVQQQFQQLRDRIEQELGGTALQGEREKQLAVINQLEKERTAQLQAEIRALQEETRGALSIRLLRAQGLNQEADAAAFAYAQAKELADTLKQFGTDAPDIVAELRVVQDAERRARDQALQDARDRAAEDRNVRSLAASGASDRAVGDLRFRIAQERELADIRKTGTADEIAATVTLLAAEKQKRDTDFAALNQQARDDAGIRALVAQGRTHEANEARLAAEQARELADAIQQGMDASTIAALTFAQAAEKAAFEAQEAARQMDQAYSDLQRDVRLGFISDAQGLASEATAFGLGGLSPEQIRAKYVPFAGSELTPEQEALNKHIEQYLSDYARLNPDQSSATAGAGAASPQGQREALTNAAQAETEATGNRLADYTSSMLGEIRFIRADVHTIAGGASLRPDLAGSELARFIGRLTPATPSGFAALNTLPTLAETPRTAGVAGMTVQVSAPITVRVVAPDGSDARQLSADLERALEPKIEDLIYRAIRAAQRKAGDTTIPV